MDMADPVSAPECIDDCIHHSRARTDSSGFACALDAKRICLARHVARLEHEVWCMFGVRHGVIHKARAKQLPCYGVIDSVLHEGLADALHRAAVYLAGK